MDKKLLAVSLGLSENAPENEIAQKLAALKEDAKLLAAEKLENKRLKDEVVRLTGEAEDQKVIGLVDSGIADKKLAAGDREKYIKLAKADFATTKDLIDNMKPYEGLQNKLHVVSEDNALEIAEMMKLSGRQLYLDGKLDRLKELSLAHFKLKYKEAFNLEYKETA